MVALAPLIAAVAAVPEEDTQGEMKSFYFGMFSGLLWSFGTLSWLRETASTYFGMSHTLSIAALAVICTTLAMQLGLFAACLSYFRACFGEMVAISSSPFAWVTLEGFRGHICSFPWNLLGDSQVANPMATSVAPLAGAIGVSFLVAAVNAILVLCVRLPLPLRLKLVVAAGLILLFESGGLLRSGRPRESDHGASRVVLVQPNLPVNFDNGEPLLTQEEEFIRLSLLTSWGGEIGTIKEQPEVIVWPEAPSHFASNDLDFRSELIAFARKMKALFIVGALGVDVSPSAPRGYFLYNSAVLVGPDGSVQGRYDKVHLVPWGEYTPIKTLSKHLPFPVVIDDFDRGRIRKSLVAEHHRYGIFICYESIFGAEVRQFVRDGAEVLVNISDDTWSGDTAERWQHINMTRMRAIENNRWIIVASNSGVTAVIAPDGAVQSLAPRDVASAVAGYFTYESSQTFYTRHGDWLCITCSIFTFLAILQGARRSSKGPSRFRNTESSVAKTSSGENMSILR